MSELLKPFAALLISPEVPMRQAILAGDKTITLRLGHRDYQAGDKLMLCCHLDSWAVMTTVVSVRHTSLAEVGQLDWEADGFDSHQEMVEGLECYYGPMIPQQNITIIRWGALEGLLTEAEGGAVKDPLSDQVDRLAKFIMAEVPGEPSESEGAVDCAIRLLRNAYTETAAPEGSKEEAAPEGSKEEE